MRLNIRSKLLFLGIGLTFVLVSFAFILSYSYYKTKVQNRYDESLEFSIDLATDWLESSFQKKESYSTESNRKELYNYIVDIYASTIRDDENYPQTEDQEALYDYLQTNYHELYPSKPGTMGMSLTSPKNRSFYSSIAADIVSSLNAADGVSGYIVYYDKDYDRYLMLVNTEFRFETENYVGVLPGSYAKLTDTDHEIIRQVEQNGYYRDGSTIIRFIDFKDKDNALLARVVLSYDDSKATQSIKDFSIVMVLSLLGAGFLLVLSYVLLSHLFIVKNINRLTVATDNFKDDVLNNRKLSVIKTNIKTHDEIKKLANSFETLEEEIILYTDKIQEEVANRLKMKSELDIASQIQMSFLPKREYVDNNVHISAYIQPAKEVGGDFYDYFYIDENHLAFIISDVSGKGVPASLFMMRGKELIKSKLLANIPLEEVCFEVNNELLANNEAGLFITSFIGVLNIKTKELSFINAGHEKPFVINNDVYQLNTKANFILGGIDNFKYVSEKIVLKENDRLFLFTDGLNESINSKEEEFGYTRILNCLNNNKVEQDHTIINNMKEDLSQFVLSQEAFDDITMLVVSLKNSKLHLKYQNPTYDIITEVTNKMDDYYAFLDKNILSTLSIMIDEILNNYISYESHDNHLVEIEISVDEKRVLLVFKSNGSAFNPLEKEDKYIDSYSDDLVPGGLGISIIKSMADQIEYQREQDYNVLIIQKNIK